MREGRVAELRLVLPSSACKPLVSLFGGGRNQWYHPIEPGGSDFTNLMQER